MPGALNLSDGLQLSHLELAGNEEVSIGVQPDRVLDGITSDGAESVTQEETALLWEIVDKINECLGTDVTEADRILFEAVSEKMASDEQLQQQAPSTTGPRSSTPSTPSSWSPWWTP